MIVAGGASVDSVPCSRSHVRRAGIAAVSETAQNIKEDFKDSLQGTNLVIYIDGKAVPEFSDVVKIVKKRVSVLAKSHMMEKEQLLAVPVTQSNSGAHQYQAVTPVLDLHLTQLLITLVDTKASL